MTGFILTLATAFVVYNILRLYGVFDRNRNTVQVKSEIKSARQDKKARQYEEKKLGIYATFTNIFRGILLPSSQERKYQFYIKRLEITSTILGRPYTPTELVGEVWLYALIGVLTIPLCLLISDWCLLIPLAVYTYRLVKEGTKGEVLTPFIIIILCMLFSIKMGKVLTVIPGIYLLGKAILQRVVLSRKVLDENAIIDDYFINLYLLLFSKLRQGSRARLQSTLDNYYFSLDSQAETEELKVMKKFVRHFLNLVALYEDHVAVTKIRELYPQATIINFCNIASQAMQGIDNYDSLISYKMQLIDRKRNIMRRKAEHLLAMGTRSIYAIWIILFIFIIVGWYSKLPTGFF